MPLLQLQLKKTNVGGVITNTPINLPGGVVKQPLVLKYFSVNTYNVVDNVIGVSIELDLAINTSCLLVDLPFLNNYDVNSNSPITNSIFIPTNYNTQENSGITQHSGPMDILFNPAKNIDSIISNWEIYTQHGLKLDETISDDTAVIVTLMFEYRRPDLI